MKFTFKKLTKGMIRGEKFDYDGERLMEYTKNEEELTEQEKLLVMSDILLQEEDNVAHENSWESFSQLINQCVATKDTKRIEHLYNAVALACMKRMREWV